jgi:4-hydroxymandelate oxidase
MCGRNIQAFNRIELRPRVLVDVSEVDLRTQVLGGEISLPVVVAPFGEQRRFHPEAELATVHACDRVGTLMAVSTVANIQIEEIAAQTSAPLWFQLYVLKNDGLTESLVRRAQASGYRAIVVTVDNPGYVHPERGESRTALTRETEFANFRGPGLDAGPTAATWLDSKSRAFTWARLSWLRSLTTLPIILKGVQTAEDAVRAFAEGVDGIIVSNHGGYAAFGGQPTAVALDEICRALPPNSEVYVDGGIRTGSDVLKALAIGAKAVLIGRAALYGLTVAGQDGVVDVLEILRSELTSVMRMCGVTQVDGVSRTLIESPRL